LCHGTLNTTTTEIIPEAIIGYNLLLVSLLQFLLSDRLLLRCSQLSCQTCFITVVVFSYSVFDWDVLMSHLNQVPNSFVIIGGRIFTFIVILLVNDRVVVFASRSSALLA